MHVLLIVDMQRDFCPGGALAVPQADTIVPIINTLAQRCDHSVATQDWHPADHVSFASVHGLEPGAVITVDGQPQVLWPDHCIQHTAGAAFTPGLDIGSFARVFFKGTDPHIDSYSGFFDNGHKKSTGLAEYLKTLNVTELRIVGLATDYCVKYTALDAVQLGFSTVVIADACRGVNLRAGDDQQALAEMARAGVRVISQKQLE